MPIDPLKPRPWILHGITVHPRQLSPPWLDGHTWVYELTRHSARKLARAQDVRLPSSGHYVVLPTASGWKELHRNPGRDKPYYVF